MSKVPARLDTLSYAKRLLPATFRNKTYWTKLLTVVAAPFQQIEDAFQDLLLLRYLSSAFGVQLDIIGEIVGLKRQGRDDSGYLIRLRARILLIRSSGTLPQIFKILRAVFSTKAYRYHSWHPAGFVVDVRSATTVADADELAGLISSAKAAGVRANMTYSTVDESATFYWNGTTSQGWNAGEWAHTAEGN